MKWIDTHAHLYVDKFKEDIDIVLQRCQDQGVDEIFLPNIDIASMASMDALVARYPDRLRPMYGLHPCSVDADYEEWLPIIEQRLEHGASYGIGETGIDLYWDTTHRDAQIENFVQHIQWAIKYRLPIIIHSRSALDLTIDLMESQQCAGLRGVFHCFDGDIAQAERIKAMGCHIGIGGVVTYKKSHLPDVLREIGLDQVVLETDSPYLPPVPHRGQRNESSYIPLVGNFVASVLDREVADVAAQTTANARQLFSPASGIDLEMEN